MTVHSLAEALADSNTFTEIAKRTGLTQAQVRAVLAEVHDLNVVQVLRMGAVAKADRVRQVNRETRVR